MSRHWNPEDELALARLHDSEAKPRWPQGATAGLALVAVCCVGLGVLFYQLAGPRDVFTP
jgi:hypothetical protein